MSTQRFTLETVATEDNFERVFTFLQTHGQECGLEQALLSKFELVCEELFVNVVTHGSGPAGPEPSFALHLEVDAERVSMTLEDDGLAFNPLEHEVQDLDASLEDRQIGGLGIHFVRELMDDVRYERVGRINRVTLIKRRSV